MRAELQDVRRYISANLSEGNRRELDLLFGGAIPQASAMYDINITL